MRLNLTSMRRATLLLPFAFCIALRADAAAPTRPPGLVREFAGISEYRLANGLQLLLLPDETMSTASVDIVYRVGSRHESAGEYGMAHLLEHLLFKGTPTHPKIYEILGRRGVRANARAGADVTRYMARFNADPATMDTVLEIEADRMVNSLVARSDLDSEMTVVRNEYESGENDFMAVLRKRVLGVAYDWHNYGHATIGLRSDIENVPIERLKAFYGRYYRPDNAMLIVGGRFDPQAVLARVTSLFGPLEVPGDPLPRTYTVEPAQDGERSVVVRRIGGQPTLMAHYHAPATTHPDAAPLLVLELMLSEAPGGPLHRELIVTGLASAAGAIGFRRAERGGLGVVALLPPGGDPVAVEARLLDLLEGRAGPAFDESQLARVLAGANEWSRELMTRPEALIDEIADEGAADWRLPFLLMSEVATVTLDDIERVRRTYLRPANRTLGRYLPTEQVERVDIPDAAPPTVRLAGLKAPPTVAAGERFDPTPALLATRTTTRRLPSGVELITLAKRTRGDKVVLRMDLRWGGREDTFRHRGSDMVGDLLLEGSLTMPRQALQDKLRTLGAHVSLTSGDQGASLAIDVERPHLLEALALAADVMQHPLLPQDAFDRRQAEMIAGLEGSRQELETLRRTAAREHYNHARGVKPGDPDYARSLDEAIAELRATALADVAHFHATYWSANEARASVVGAIPDGLDAAIERLFGRWKKPSAPGFVRHEPKADVIPAARFDVVARDKAGAAMTMRVDFALSERDPDYVPLALATRILGGSPESRLSRRIREQAGLSYDVRAWMSTGDVGDAAALTVSALFAPQNRDLTVSLVREELAAMTRDGIRADELALAKTELLAGRRLALADDMTVADLLLDQADRGETWAQAAQRDATIQAATIEQVNRSWRRRIRLDDFVVTTVGDFKDLR
ncbi:M16 family metallopeptidase [Roseateles sp. L2-2]|uniref:M16 family metallopeptidase n=1 Tax=Roseateles sp. L2-2 TaxID=3422597 RepID=UPI003D361532